MKLEPNGTGFIIDAADLGPLLDLPPADIPALMRLGQITSLSEAGQGADAGRFRVTFRYGAVRLRFTLDADGNVLSRIRTTASAHPDASIR